MPDAIRDGIIALAQFTALARSPVFHDRRTGAIDLIPEPEGPGRLAKQLALLARALAIVRQEREVSLTTYLTVVQVANDTLPAPRQVMLNAVKEQDVSASTSEIASATRYPTESARRYLEELAAVQLVTLEAEGQGHAHRWRESKTLQDLREEISRPLPVDDYFTNKTRVGEIGE